MGRLKATKLTGKFYLRTDRKADQNGKYAIYLDYVVGTQHARTETGVWIEEKYWDADKRVINRKHPQCAYLNNLLENKRIEIDSALLEHCKLNKRVSIQVIRDIVQGKYNGKSMEVDFVDYALKINDEEYKLNRIGVSVYNNAICGLNLFKKFLLEYHKEDSIFVSEMTIDVVRQYIFWRQGRGNSNETINKTLTPLMKAAKRAAEEKLMDVCIANAIGRMYLNKTDDADEDESKDVFYLTLEQMKQFLSLYEEVKYPRTRDYMDMFLFSFNAWGLRVSDIITLEWKHIDFENHKLVKKLIKKRGQGKRHEITLNDDAMRILEKWKEKNGSGRFVFGLLPDDFDIQNKQELNRQRLNKNRPILQSLQTIGEKMGLPFRLRMHVARHTFAVWALNRGVDVKVISEMLAHSSVLVTEKVYAKFMPSTLEKEVQDKLNFNLLNG